MANLIDEINEIRKKIHIIDNEVKELPKTDAGYMSCNQLRYEQRELHLKLGRLCANSGVLICLQ